MSVRLKLPRGGQIWKFSIFTNHKENIVLYVSTALTSLYRAQTIKALTKEESNIAATAAEQRKNANIE